MSIRTPFEPSYLHNLFFSMLTLSELIVMVNCHHFALVMARRWLWNAVRFYRLFYVFRYCVAKRLLTPLWPIFNSRAGFIRGYKRWNTTQWNTLWEGNNAANFVYIVLIAWLPVCLLFLFPIDGQFSTCFASVPDVQWIVLLNFVHCFQDQGYALAADGPAFHTLEGLLRHYHECTTTLQRLTRPYNDKP